MRRIILVVGAFVMLASTSIGWAANNSYLGNMAIDRERTDGLGYDQAGWWDFLVLDLSPESQITSAGNITSWRWYAKQWSTNDVGQEMDLMVWRPVASEPGAYELVLKQRVVSKTWGAQAARVDDSAVGSTSIRPGDVLGYYVPQFSSSVLAFDRPLVSGGDYQTSSLSYYSSASGYYWSGCGSVDVGTVRAFSADSGAATHSLGAIVTDQPIESVVPEPASLLVACAVLSPSLMFFRRKRIQRNLGRGTDAGA